MKFSLHFVLCLFLFTASTARADVTTTGNIDPGNLSDCNPLHGYIGKTSNGTLLVANGSEIALNVGYLGYASGATGTAMISGTGSTWTNENLYIGYSGTGILNITDGGTVNTIWQNFLGYEPGAKGTVIVSGTNSTWNSNRLDVGWESDGKLYIINGGSTSVQTDTWVSHWTGSSGSISFDNGTLTTGSLYAGSNHLLGTGTINTNGLIADDIDLVFDATHGLQQTFTLNDQTKNITIHLDQTASGALGAGYTNQGSLSIKDGVTVESKEGLMGWSEGSIGIVTVSGVNSTWNIERSLNLAYRGKGVLNVTDGGTVNCNSTWIGDENATGIVNVSGSGSTWTHGSLWVGNDGTGELNITNGGTVTNVRHYTPEGEIYHNGINISGSADSKNKVTVSDTGSTWTTLAMLNIGGELEILNGGTVNSNGTWIGSLNSSGIVTVSGKNSKWINHDSLYLGIWKSGTINIINGGLVSVTGILKTDDDASSINLSTGGMLALEGEADTSLEAFFDLIDGSDAIRWWDESLDNWALLTTATMNTDYTLEYLTEGDLAGYTLLTVGIVPEPGCAALVLSALLAMGFISMSRNNHVARYSSQR